MSGPFGLYAQSYFDVGLSPIPLVDKSSRSKVGKKPAVDNWQLYSRQRYSETKLKDFIKEYDWCNIGIVLGTEIEPGYQLCAIDIDDESSQEHIEAALPAKVCGKKGQKGVTWFYLCPSDIKVKRKVNKKGTVVELLADKSQTVIPPSIHPDTGNPYHWVTRPLLEVDPRNLPKIRHEFLKEAEEISAGVAQYFIGGQIDGIGEFPGLNNMIYVGQGGGGNTHEVRLRVIAHMLATGWSDEAIQERLSLAMRRAYEAGGVDWDSPDWLEPQTAEMISSAKAKGFAKEDKGPPIPIERAWADWLITQFDHPVSYGGDIFSYADGHYSKNREEKVTAQVLRTFPHATAAKANAAYQAFSLLSYNPEFGDGSGELICLNNGTLNTRTAMLRSWSPDDELLYKLDLNWDPKATCPQYEKFINWMFKGDAQSINLFEEYAGLTFVDDMSHQKSLWLVGRGGNGKSTLVTLLQKIHDQSVLSNISITDLNDERKVTSLVGKLLNVSSEHSRLNNMVDTVFKQITGGDSIPIRKLYQEVDNNVYLKVRFLCLTNDMPTTADTSEAMRRRLLMLDCPQQLTDAEKDPDLGNKLLAEKSGILLRWVNALNRLRARGRFDVPDHSNKMVNEFLISNDSLRFWINDSITKGEDEHDALQIYADYADWCKATGFKYPYKYPEWLRKMGENGFEVGIRDFDNGNTSRVIKLKRTNLQNVDMRY